MSNAPRENRVFSTDRSSICKCAVLARRSRDDLSTESRFCLTSVRGKGCPCAGEGRARQPSGLPACFLLFHRKGDSCSNEQNIREKARRNPAFRKDFPRNEAGNPATCGHLRHALRRKKVFIAQDGAFPCGKQTAFLRDYS